MSFLSQGRLIDIMRDMDLSLIEAEFPEKDLECQEPIPECEPARNKIKIALISGLAASSLALTGVVVLLCRRRGLRGKIA